MVRRRLGRTTTGIAVALLGFAPTSAFAQEQLDPPPPQPDTTTIVEPVPEPETPPDETPPAESEPEELKESPKDASGIDLSTLETKNVSMLYFDPVQTYLTP